MCISCPAKVVGNSEEFVDIEDALGRKRQVKNAVGAKAGDHILVGMGYAVQLIPEDEYEISAKIYRENMQ